MSDESLQVEWLIEGRLMRVLGTLDREMMALRNRLVLEAIEAKGQPPLVHSLIDHRNQYTPEQVATQPKLLRDYVLDDDEVRRKLLSHLLLGWVISVATPNMGLKIAGTVMSQRDEYRWRTVLTMQEALDWLQLIDSTLPDLKELKLE